MFHVKHIYTEEVEKALDACKIIFAEGYFITVSMDTLLSLGHRCLHSPGKLFSMGLGAKWVVDTQFTNLMELMPYVDILFGNEDESRAFAVKMDWEEKY